VVDFTLPTKVVTFALFSGGTSIFPCFNGYFKSCSVGLAISIVEDLN
jgi:hypothetical protein